MTEAATKVRPVTRAARRNAHRAAKQGFPWRRLPRAGFIKWSDWKKLCQSS